jgi:hypothetical protein
MSTGARGVDGSATWPSASSSSERSAAQRAARVHRARYAVKCAVAAEAKVARHRVAEEVRGDLVHSRGSVGHCFCVVWVGVSVDWPAICRRFGPRCRKEIVPLDQLFKIF